MKPLFDHVILSLEKDDVEATIYEKDEGMLFTAITTVKGKSKSLAQQFIT